MPRGAWTWCNWTGLILPEVWSSGRSEAGAGRWETAPLANALNGPNFIGASPPEFRRPERVPVGADDPDAAASDSMGRHVDRLDCAFAARLQDFKENLQP